MADKKDFKADFKTTEQMDAELKELEVQAARLSILEKEANLQDVKERLAEREMVRETKRMRSLTNGQTLKQLLASDRAAQARCNHHKGGQGMNAIAAGQGDDPQYSIFKHMFCNGDTWVSCLRCHKTWKPPLRKNYLTDEGYEGALKDYNAALLFQTRNISSSSYVFKFSDGGDYFREVTDATNLR